MGLQVAEDLDGLRHVRGLHDDLLEAAVQGAVLLHDLRELVHRGCAHALDFTPGEGRLEDVGCVHRAAAAPGTHEGVDLVDEEDDFAVGLDDLVHNALQTLLELAFVLGTGNQGAHIKGEEFLGLQILGDIATDQTLGQSFRDSGLADTGLTNQNRVVLGTARQNLQHTADLLVTTDDRIEFALLGHLVEVLGVLVQGVVGLLLVLAGDLLAVMQFRDGRFESFFGNTGVLQHLRRLPTGHEDTVEQVFKCQILVAGAVAEHGGFLHGSLGGAAEIDFVTAALGQTVDFALHRLLERGGVARLFLQQEGDHVVIRVEHRLEDVQGVHLLVLVSGRQHLGVPDYLLGFDC